MGHKPYIVNLEGAIYRGEHYLMAMRSTNEAHAGGTLGFVGGTAEPEDEQQPDMMTAWLQREIREEVGVAVGPLHYVTSSTFMTSTGETVLNIVFLCPYLSGDARAVDPAEVEWVQWMSAAAIRQHPAVQPWTQRYLDACERLRPNLPG